MVDLTALFSVLSPAMLLTSLLRRLPSQINVVEPPPSIFTALTHPSPFIIIASSLISAPRLAWILPSQTKIMIFPSAVAPTAVLSGTIPGPNRSYGMISKLS